MKSNEMKSNEMKSNEMKSSQSFFQSINQSITETNLV